MPTQNVLAGNGMSILRRHIAACPPLVTITALGTAATVIGCGPGRNGPTDMSCTELMAVNTDRPLVITMSFEDANTDQVAGS